MTIAAGLLAEFEQEAVTTRKFLERLPSDKLDWRPHPKSMTAGQLAFHIAMVPGQVIQLAQVEEVPAPDFSGSNPQPVTTSEILDALEASIIQVRTLLPSLTDERMQGTWRMTLGERELLAMPRVAFLRNVLLNHWYHHRGQFGVYLRLLGASVPSSYGPSGDEMPAFMA